MNPYPRHQSLFFTPRTPWGTRLTGRTFRNHMRASEDNKQPSPSSKDMQGLGGQMAPNQLSGPKEKLPNPNDYDIVRKPQSAQRPNSLSQPLKEASLNGEKPKAWDERSLRNGVTPSAPGQEGHWDFNVESSGMNPRKSDTSVEGSWSKKPKVKKDQEEWETKNPPHFSSDPTVNKR